MALGVISKLSLTLDQFAFGAWSLLVAAMAAMATWFLKPLLESAASKLLVRSPRFGVVDAFSVPERVLIVEALNRLAKKNKPLNGIIDGILYAGGGSLLKNKGRYLWTFKLDESPLLKNTLSNKLEVEAAFFFDDHAESAASKIKFRGGPASIGEYEASSITRVSNLTDFIGHVASNKRILLDCREIELRISEKSHLANDRAKWYNVYDGHELTISNVSNFELHANSAKIIAVPRYAWVLAFERSFNIRLDGMTLGHLEEGACQGGVIKLMEVSSAKFNRLDLFGCGTYGLEFDKCKNIQIEDCVIRDCSYGIMHIKDSSNIAFSNCTFMHNRQFDLIELFGSCSNIVFKDCIFKNNQSLESFFKFDNRNIESSVSLQNCEFQGNQYRSFSGAINLKGVDTCTLSNNVISSAKPGQWTLT